MTDEELIRWIATNAAFTANGTRRSIPRRDIIEAARRHCVERGWDWGVKGEPKVTG